MADGVIGAHHRSLARSKFLNNHCQDLPSLVLLELIRSLNPERAFEIAEILLHPGFEASLRRELPVLLESAEYTQREFAIMVVLVSREPEQVTPADLAYALGISIGALRYSLQALNKTGSIAHHHCRKHRRRTYIMATDQGRSQSFRALVNFLACLEFLGRGLPATARLVLNHVCDGIRARATRYITSEPVPRPPHR